MGETTPLLHPCPNCAALIDVTEQQPFDQVHCPMCGTAMRVRTQFNNFAIQELLGSGGMGAVFKALDMNLNRMVALKVVRKEFSSDAEYLAKFEREARITASVNHPHVVKVFSFGSDHGLFYIAMELVDKGSLDDLMLLQGRVSEMQVLSVGIQIAQGLEAAFRSGLIHRDVKPGNILFADAQTSKIVDFGLALLAEQEAEARGEIWGTPYYVAPEKLNHEPEDFRSDIYSLGGTLFHAVSGRPPYEAETASMVALKHIKSQKVSLQAFAPDVSSATAYVINRMLEKEPDDRYQSYAELIEHLSYARTQLEEASGRGRRSRILGENSQQQTFFAVISLALFGLLIACGLVLWFFRGSIFPGSAPEPEPLPKTVAQVEETPALVSMAVRFAQTRQEIAKGRFSQARETFKKLGTEETEQPLKSWLMLHEGLCALLEGKPEEARQLFNKLQQAGLFSSKPEDQQLARFFVDTSKALSDPQQVRVLVGLNKKNQDALALFLFGLSDFQNGNFESANDCFEEFLKTTPESPYDWVSSYKLLIQPYTEQLAVFMAAKGRLAQAQTLEQQRAASEALIQSAQLVKSPKLKAQIEQLGRDFTQKIQEATEQERAAHHRVRQADEAVMQVGRQKFKAACLSYDFPAASAVAEALQVQEIPASKEKKKLLKKAQWLQQFHQRLILDISSKPYPNVVVKKSGTRLPAGANVATSTEVQMRTTYGAVVARWQEIPPQMLLAMANYYLETAKTDPEKGQRAWLSGVFASEFGMEREGNDLLLKAAQFDPKYRGELGNFFETVTAQ